MDIAIMDLLTPAEVAEFLCVSPVTVRAWARKGFIAAELTPGGHRRFARQEVIDFAHRFGIKPRRDQEAHKILIIDRDTEMSDYLKQCIASVPYRPVVLRTHESFDAGIVIGELNPDLVLIDLQNPSLDGAHICSTIKRRNPMTRVIGLSAFRYSSEEHAFLEAGGEACIYKPIDLQRLYRLLGTSVDEVEGANQNMKTRVTGS